MVASNPFFKHVRVGGSTMTHSIASEIRSPDVGSHTKSRKQRLVQSSLRRECRFRSPRMDLRAAIGRAVAIQLTTPRTEGGTPDLPKSASALDIPCLTRACTRVFRGLTQCIIRVAVWGMNFLSRNAPWFPTFVQQTRLHFLHFSIDRTR